MPAHIVPPSDALPRSHYFITLSRGSGMRTVAVRAPLVQLAMLVVPLVLLAGLCSTLYLALHDDLMAGLMRRESAMQYAYEDRIEALRQDLERQAERSRADASTIDARVHDLFAREATLEGRAAAVASLAAEVAPVAGRPALPAAITGRASATPAAALGYAAPDKPRPVVEPATRGPAGAAGLEDHASLLDAPTVPLGDRLGAVASSLERVGRGQVAALTRIGAAAHARAARIRDLIETAGLSPERYLPKAAGAGLGGPFVPLPEGPDGGFDRAVAELRGTVAAAGQLEAALPRLPLAAPLLGRMDVTSPFGARTDPFLGRPALHTGVDLREGYGTDIRATGAGRVSFAGTAGGYGNMVEVDHGNGLATRYAHMGSVSVAEGQAVARGAVLGFVGATGRATGPHLHYEVRIDGEPVDPTRFLASADRLASLGAP
ncbi:M23 family peptidase [Lichenibacterium minor]|uniref:M23 family peptidase n=1 Tax=Lichenibacterium minor TaxID=2316528 RepID=A0A4Q2U5M5_9HYPH|nr:M23 family metallopeptidase [Lichenibacterium minor]RYC31722.1 M23 family peptidase [Lichenibacterium minor]